MILKEDADTYFESVNTFTFMNTIRKAKPETIEKYPYSPSRWRTSRLQEITEEPHRTLLQEWKKETGCPMLLNTSLNVKGQPIINNETEQNNSKQKTRKGFIGDNMHGSFKKMLKESIHESQKCQRNWEFDATISEEDKKLILEAATNSPSKQNLNYFKLHVIEDRDVIDAIHDTQRVLTYLS